MSELKQFMNILFKKYNIYNKKEFLSVLIYILRSTLDEIIQYESEYQYCIEFYLLYFQSVPYNSVSTDILLKLLLKQRDPNFIVSSSLTVAPSISFGVLADKLFKLLETKSLRLASDFNDISDLNIETLNNNLYRLNGEITSSTVRGCVWKLLYASLKYHIDHLI